MTDRAKTDRWVAGTLGHYIERPEYGYTDRASNHVSNTKFLRITDIQDGTVNWDAVPYCACPSNVAETKRLRPGDIVVARIGATTGKSFYIETPVPNAVFASYLIRLRTKSPALLPRYLYFYMQANEYWSHINRHKGDRLKGGISIPSLESLPLRVPPRRDQERIVAVLDLVREAIKSEVAQEESSIELKTSGATSLFTRGLRGESGKDTEIGTIPQNWTTAAIDDIAVKTQYGLSIPGQTVGEFPILRMNCQEQGRVVFRDLQFVNLDEATFAAYRLHEGDLLFNRTNSIEHVGRTAIFEGAAPAVFASYLIRLTVDQSRCSPCFLNYYMNRRDVQREIKRLASRSVGQANINATKLRTVRFPLPPSLDEQHEIIAVLRAIDDKIILHQQRRTVIEALFNSLLQKLLTGEIAVADLDVSALERAPAEAPA